MAGREDRKRPKGISSLSRNSVTESQVETPGLCAGPAHGQPTCPTGGKTLPDSLTSDISQP